MGASDCGVRRVHGDCVLSDIMEKYSEFLIRTKDFNTLKDYDPPTYEQYRDEHIRYVEEQQKIFLEKYGKSPATQQDLFDAREDIIDVVGKNVGDAIEHAIEKATRPLLDRIAFLEERCNSLEEEFESQYETTQRR
jgi:hypothetical protein